MDIPWYRGIAADSLADAVKPLVESLQVEDLSNEPDLWGGPVNDERYAVICITPA